MLQCGDVPVCYSVGMSLYATVWGCACMLQCGDVPVCYSVGMCLYATVWE